MDAIALRVNAWEKHNPRKDVKRPSWFSFDNRMIEDEDFFAFSHGEFKVWIYILSKASQKQSADLRLSIEHANRVCNLSAKEFKSAVSKLEALGIVTVDVTCTSRVRHADVQNPYATLQTDITDKTDITLPTGTEAPVRTRIDLDLIYAEYPRKEGKAEGLRKLKSIVKTEEDFGYVMQAVRRYADHCREKGTEPKFIKHFSSFVSSWTDWLDPETGTAAVPEAGLSTIDLWLRKQDQEAL